MANSVTLHFSDSQMRTFEQLLDEFNETMKRIESNQPQRQERMAKLDAEIQLLLGQAEDEIKRLRDSRSHQRKMVWEK